MKVGRGVLGCHFGVWGFGFVYFGVGELGDRWKCGEVCVDGGEGGGEGGGLRERKEGREEFEV